MQDISHDTIVRAAEGDMGAFEEIYRKASGYVYTIALRMTRNAEDAEEVTQDVFLNVYRNLKKFRFKASIKTWMYRITVNRAINLINRRSRKRGKTVPYEEYMNVDNEPPQQTATIENKEKEDLVGSMLDILPPEQRACIVLREIGGLNYREIAEARGINLNTVRSRLKRAREKLSALYRRGGQQK